MIRAMIRTPLALFAILIWAASAGGQDSFYGNINKTVLYEGNGNHYLLLHQERPPEGQFPSRFRVLEWQAAMQKAITFSYEGVQGRLAQINSPELESFIRVTMNARGFIWIGIAYDCVTKKMIYQDGTLLDRKNYTHWHPTNWGPRTADNRPKCSLGNGGRYMGAAMIQQFDGAPYWRLYGVRKGFKYVLVEFPTGEQAAETTSDSTESEGN